jgi:orotate phosphoribosyltransferase
MLEGHFLLSSGRHSDRYFQCARLLRYPGKAEAALAPVAERLRAAIASGRLAVDTVAGPALGGIFVAWELGRQLGLPAIFTERNDEGQMVLRRGFEVRPGERILIAEDVVTTGKSSGECAAALESVGAVIAALACVVDRRSTVDRRPAPESAAGNSAAVHGTDSAELPWPLYAACRVEAQTWEAGSCELCKAGIPAVKPGSRKDPGSRKNPGSRKDPGSRKPGVP